MRKAAIVDCNVIAVVNELASQADVDCMSACIDVLESLRRSSVVVLDDADEILREYRGVANPGSRPGIGSEFLLWLLRNIGNDQHCRRVAITAHPTRTYVEFPDDAALAGFDEDDRKYVAVAVADGARAVVMNATDPGWVHFAEALAGHGIETRTLCPDVIRRSRRGSD